MMLKKLFFSMAVLFATTCFAQQVIWSTPIDLSTSNSNTPDIKINENDIAVAVWVWNNGSFNVIQERHSFDGGINWTPPQVISTSTTHSRRPKVALNDNNLAIVLWGERDPSNDYRITESHCTLGVTSWTPRKYLSTAGNDSDYPKIALNNQGHAIGVWQYYNGSNYRIESNHSLDGSVNWTGNTFLSPNLFNAFEPEIAMNNNDQAIVLMRRNDGSNNLAEENHTSNAGASWSGANTLSDIGKDTNEISVDINESGIGLATWKISSGTPVYVQVRQTINAGNTWQPVINLNSSTNPFYFTQVQINDNNKAVATWALSDGSNPLLQTEYSIDGGANWSSPYFIPPLRATQKYPVLAMNNENIVAAFYGLDDGSDYLTQCAVSFDGGVTWPSTETISLAGADSTEFQITMNEKNIILGIWERNNAIQISYPISISYLNTATNTFTQRSLFQNQIINEITWDNLSYASYYKVYADANLTDLVYQGKDPYFYGGVKKGESKSYYIVYVDNTGNESLPTIVTIP